ncbi:hypothetical protein [uncultured Gammaproteobacteria bacterium]|nr:hypothetical protein [uncultured Gammaproteobacteria bacterium]
MSVIRYLVRSESETEDYQVILFSEYASKLKAMDWVTTLMLRTNDENTKWECGQEEDFLESSDSVKFYDLQNPEHARQCEEDGY